MVATDPMTVPQVCSEAHGGARGANAKQQAQALKEDGPLLVDSAHMVAVLLPDACRGYYPGRYFVQRILDQFH